MPQHGWPRRTPRRVRWQRASRRWSIISASGLAAARMACRASCVWSRCNSAGRCEVMRSWIHHAKGRHVRQARVGLGDLREEHISRQGFFGPVAMVYRQHGPNEIVRIEGSLRPPRVADTARTAPAEQFDPRRAPEAMLSNPDVSVAISRRTAWMPYAYRNTDGDLLYFVHQGSGSFATEFG